LAAIRWNNTFCSERLRSQVLPYRELHLSKSAEQRTLAIFAFTVSIAFESEQRSQNLNPKLPDDRPMGNEVRRNMPPCLSIDNMSAAKPIRCQAFSSLVLTSLFYYLPWWRFLPSFPNRFSFHLKFSYLWSINRRNRLLWMQLRVISHAIMFTGYWIWRVTPCNIMPCRGISIDIDDF
jgi:hypothetical protein